MEYGFCHYGQVVEIVGSGDRSPFVCPFGLTVMGNEAVRGSADRKSRIGRI